MNDTDASDTGESDTGESDTDAGTDASTAAGNFGTNEQITTLINGARERAIKSLVGHAVTPKVLDDLANRVHFGILEDVALGKWSDVGIVDPDDFIGLEVGASVRKTSTGAPLVVLEYDFSRTKHAHLVAETVVP